MLLLGPRLFQCLRSECFFLRGQGISFKANKQTPGSGLSHVDPAGRAQMVDVGAKEVTKRTAVASGAVVVGEEIHRLIRENALKKGDVCQVARLAGIMAAKRTSELIPLCHPLALTKVAVEVDPMADGRSVGIRGTVECQGRTGVEMEALMAVSVAALTVYDMCKAVSHEIRITDIALEEKTGGKRDYSAGAIAKGS